MIHVQVAAASIESTWANSFLKNDSYVTVDHDGRWGHTCTKHNTQKPSWNEDILLYYQRYVAYSDVTVYAMWGRAVEALVLLVCLSIS